MSGPLFIPCAKLNRITNMSRCHLEADGKIMTAYRAPKAMPTWFDEPYRKFLRFVFEISLLDHALTFLTRRQKVARGRDRGREDDTRKDGLQGVPRGTRTRRGVRLHLFHRGDIPGRLRPGPRHRHIRPAPEGQALVAAGQLPWPSPPHRLDERHGQERHGPEVAPAAQQAGL